MVKLNSRQGIRYEFQLERNWVSEESSRTFVMIDSSFELTAIYDLIELQFEVSCTFNKGKIFSFQTSVMSKSYTTIGNYK